MEIENSHKEMEKEHNNQNNTQNEHKDNDAWESPHTNKRQNKQDKKEETKKGENDWNKMENDQTHTKWLDGKYCYYKETHTTQNTYAQYSVLQKYDKVLVI